MNYPIEILIDRYLANADQADAMAMRKYLKNQFEFIGIRSPKRRALTKIFFKEYGKPSKEDFSAIVHYLYGLKQREFHYLAMDIANLFKKKWDVQDLGVIEHMMLNQQWWDTIDFIAVHLIGSFLKKYPARVAAQNAEYISHENMWVRRVALLFQLKYKKDLDPKLLKSNILKCAHEKAFFIEKAIGWILREYSKDQAQWVRDFIQNNDLRPLSVREASKYL